MRSTAIALTTVAALVLLASCSEHEGAATDAGSNAGDAADGGGGESVFAAGCTTNGDCAGGLFCMQSEFAPSGWCTVFCDNPGDHCVDAALNGAGGLCVQMPTGFRGPSKPFCTMKCDNSNDCTAVWASWERCAKPSYKNENIYNDLPTRVCEAPSAHGQVRVDPIACTWESDYMQPQYQEAKQVCKAYCTYLKTCQLFDTKKENYDCCTWRCFQKATPQGKVDETYMGDLKCYTQAFYVSYQGTGEVCTGPTTDCGEPDPMRDKK